MPISREDRIISVCLSGECLRQENLEIASRYIHQKDRLPGFRDKVRQKAETIVDRMPDELQVPNSFVSASFFEERFVVED